MQVNPIADLFPMLAEDELAELAEDIKQRGLLQPIVLDAEGRVLDGRNRLAACERAGVEPDFETYDGDDPDGYALSVNIQRRNLTKGQQAMVAARAASVSKATKASAAKGAGVSAARVAQAATVLEFAPDLVDTVLAGALSLDKAYETARERKEKAQGVEAQLARLRSQDPELADRVVEGDLTLTGAQAELKGRIAEAERQRKVATHLLCEIVPALAQTSGTDAAEKYDPAQALPGRAITRTIIDQALAALQKIDAAWQERGLA